MFPKGSRMLLLVALAMTVDSRSALAQAKLSEMRKIWDSEAQQLIASIARESFSETLANTADWDSNYAKMGPHNDYMTDPGFPYATEVIFLSRRYAKLVEAIREDPNGKLEIVAAQLTADILKYRKLELDGQSYLSSPQRLTAPENGHASDLIWPLVWRMDVCMLLIGFSERTQDLPIVFETIDSLGKTVNPAVAAYAIDKILTKQAKAGHSLGARAKVLHDYMAWKGALIVGSPFKQYETLTLPGWKSVRRPGDRSVVLDGKPSFGSGIIKIEKPPRWQSARLQDFADEKSAYYGSDHIIDQAFRIIEFGRAFRDVG